MLEGHPGWFSTVVFFGFLQIFDREFTFRDSTIVLGNGLESLLFFTSTPMLTCSSTKSPPPSTVALDSILSHPPPQMLYFSAADRYKGKNAFALRPEAQSRSNPTTLPERGVLSWGQIQQKSKQDYLLIFLLQFRTLH